MRRRLHWILPIVILAVGFVGMRGLIALRAEPDRAAPEKKIPTVRTLAVEVAPHRFVVRTQGTVEARTRSHLVAEVAGRVIETAPSFVDGGFFEGDEVLLRMDDRDARAQLAQRRSQLSSAELRLELELEQRRVAVQEWEQFDAGEATPLVLREPQVAEARAVVEAAQAQVEKAQRDLERTMIRAPYDGRVRQQMVDVGDYLQPGMSAAQVYAVDYAEVRLPLPDADLAFLDLPLDFRNGRSRPRGPEVLLRARFAGADHEWRGWIDRTEGQIDPLTRMIHAVVRVEDPYGRRDDARVPLSVGMFVQAEIRGRSIEEGVVLPLVALYDSGSVLVVDDENRIRQRPVEILRQTEDDFVVGSGLRDGELVCVTSLETVVDGMEVRPLDTPEVSGEAAR